MRANRKVKPLCKTLTTTETAFPGGQQRLENSEKKSGKVFLITRQRLADRCPFWRWKKVSRRFFGAARENSFRHSLIAGKIKNFPMFFLLKRAPGKRTTLGDRGQRLSWQYLHKYRERSGGRVTAPCWLWPRRGDKS